MSVSASRPAPGRSGGVTGEVTRLNCQRQFKPFIYLNSRGGLPGPRGERRLATKKVPPFGRDSVLSLNLGQFRSELASALALLIGVLALAVRILLLLSGLLATALLLTGLLARVLVLLARILVLVRHRDLPGFDVTPANQEARNWLQGNSGFTGMIA